MSYGEYWHGDPWLVRDYLKAEEYRRERMNFNSWLDGLYVAKAIDATIGNAFRKENTPPSEYPDEPIKLYPTEDEQEAREQKEMDAAELYLKQFIEYGKRWGKKDAHTPQG